MGQDHKDTQHLEGQSGHNEEVDRDEFLEVVDEKGFLGLRRWFTGAIHILGDSSL
jgi:hypothetical protein